MKIRVYYEDTDIGGVVYHTGYIRFCERARSEVFFKSDIEVTTKSGHFVVKELNCRFLKSSTLGDMLEVKNRVNKIKNASFYLTQKIFKDDDLIFDMDVTLVFVENRKISKIPPNIKEFLVTQFR